MQDSTNPFADVQYGPSARTDARHKVTISAIIQAPWGFTVSPIFRYRSALPLHIWYGYDNNLDGTSNDLYTTAYQYTGISDAGVASFKEIGACDTINCGRGAALSQMNLRVSKGFALGHGMHVEGYRRGLQPVQRDQPGVPGGRGLGDPVLHGHAATATRRTRCS